MVSGCISKISQELSQVVEQEANLFVPRVARSVDVGSSLILRDFYVITLQFIAYYNFLYIFVNSKIRNPWSKDINFLKI